MLKRLSISATILAATTVPALAHLNPEAHGSFISGLTHPLSGADHMLAMIAVGLWAAQIGGRAKWVVPVSFVSLMVIGFVLALAGAPIPFVEPGILASVIGLGLLVALAVNMPTQVATVVVGIFALFHGHGHGGELGAATALPFGSGFIVATALLHAFGLGLGMLIASRHQMIARALGVFTALGGTWLAFG